MEKNVFKMTTDLNLAFVLHFYVSFTFVLKCYLFYLLYVLSVSFTINVCFL